MVKGLKECLITCFALSANFNVEMDSPTLHLTREEEGTIEREGGTGCGYQWKISGPESESH